MASRSPKPIIVVHPESASEKVVSTLERAGYAVLVSASPEHFKELDVVSRAVIGNVTRAALQTISGTRWSDVQETFGKRVADALLEASHG